MACSQEVKQPLVATGKPGFCYGAIDVDQEAGDVKKSALLEKPVSSSSRLQFSLSGRFGEHSVSRLLFPIFALLACLGFVCLCSSVTDAFMTGRRQWEQEVCCCLLILAAALAAAASQAHEALAAEVTQLARTNAAYSEKARNYSNLLDKQAATRRRLEEIQGNLASRDELIQIISSIDRCLNLEMVGTMFRAFTSSEKMSGDADMNLQGDELADFLNSCKSVLEKELPDFDLHRLHQKATKTGLSFSCVSLLIGAVLRTSQDRIKQAEAMLKLVSFALEPLEKWRLFSVQLCLTEPLHNHPDYGSESALRGKLLDLSRSARIQAGLLQRPGCVPEHLLAPLAKAVVTAKSWPCDNMMGV